MFTAAQRVPTLVWNTFMGNGVHLTVGDANNDHLARLKIYRE